MKYWVKYITAYTLNLKFILVLQSEIWWQPSFPYHQEECENVSSSLAATANESLRQACEVRYADRRYTYLQIKHKTLCLS
jgi:hypothetical protein